MENVNMVSQKKWYTNLLGLVGLALVAVVTSMTTSHIMKACKAGSVAVNADPDCAYLDPINFGCSGCGDGVPTNPVLITFGTNPAVTVPASACLAPTGSMLSLCVPSGIPVGLGSGTAITVAYPMPDGSYWILGGVADGGGMAPNPWRFCGRTGVYVPVPDPTGGGVGCG